MVGVKSFWKKIVFTSCTRRGRGQDAKGAQPSFQGPFVSSSPFKAELKTTGHEPCKKKK